MYIACEAVWQVRPDARSGLMSERVYPVSLRARATLSRVQLVPSRSTGRRRRVRTMSRLYRNFSDANTFSNFSNCSCGRIVCN
ncbi:unnamed protein product [Pieris brassicae]|uniref:Uncharacterized protein n=1 Tax=Pieris brassicae TaxID=7116 RepID=A0A9P0TMR6_PIEBR|nr:unnamed protein product [Pieris brassicae]